MDGLMDGWMDGTPISRLAKAGATKNKGITTYVVE